jgi:hypothetical protein
MLASERSAQLDRLLGLTIAELDIPGHVREAAVAEYTAVAQWLRDSWPVAEGEIYPQGSIRLGTMVAPVTDGCEYDIDLVCCLVLTKDISKKRLKRLVGEALQGFILTRPADTVRLEEGKRCWTLVYEGLPFHMDVLPAIPNQDEAPDGIWLTDRALFEWQPSNPMGYANWFASRMERETQILLASEAVLRGIDVEEVPPDSVKTTLQQSVQALKRHRDIHFERDPELAPASIVVTTLAGKAFLGGESVFEVLVDLAARMPEFIEKENGIWVVSNPVLKDENFADRWIGEPGRAQAFFDWIDTAHANFSALGANLDAPRLLESLAAEFGEGPAHRAGRHFAADTAKLRDAGKLRTGSSGVLGVSGAAMANPRHTFHGAAHNPR